MMAPNWKDKLQNKASLNWIATKSRSRPNEERAKLINQTCNCSILETLNVQWSIGSIIDMYTWQHRITLLARKTNNWTKQKIQSMSKTNRRTNVGELKLQSIIISCCLPHTDCSLITDTQVNDNLIINQKKNINWNRIESIMQYDDGER